MSDRAAQLEAVSRLLEAQSGSRPRPNDARGPRAISSSVWLWSIFEQVRSLTADEAKRDRRFGNSDRAGRTMASVWRRCRLSWEWIGIRKGAGRATTSECGSGDQEARSYSHVHPR